VSKKGHRHHQTMPVRRDPTSVQVVQQQASFSGPLPPPQTLAAYDQTCPGAAERILAMAERQAAHRQGLEKMALHANVINERIGTCLGFLITLVAIGAGMWMLANGAEAAGVSTIIGAIAGLAGVFIYGKKKTVEERDRKLRQLNAPPANGTR
jgi:uncharacterized membrane protein